MYPIPLIVHVLYNSDSLPKMLLAVISMEKLNGYGLTIMVTHTSHGKTQAMMTYLNLEICIYVKMVHFNI